MYRVSVIATTGAERNVKLIEEIMPIGEWRFIPNGVDQTIFYKEKNSTSSPPFLLTVGGVKPRKGADVTISALAKIKDKFPDLQYKIVGENES
jgi:glycosyltransferase involved in cell wall biosynthesis